RLHTPSSAQRQHAHIGIGRNLPSASQEKNSYKYNHLCDFVSQRTTCISRRAVMVEQKTGGYSRSGCMLWFGASLPIKLLREEHFVV
ncbi:MAG: hypothetical protein J7L25_04995, partial [Deltaproteobacteria bacterium]|nr:hypothetical protein [Candidatus Tharpella aukensis]